MAGCQVRTPQCVAVDVVAVRIVRPLGGGAGGVGWRGVSGWAGGKRALATEACTAPDQLRDDVPDIRRRSLSSASQNSGALFVVPTLIFGSVVRVNLHRAQGQVAISSSS